MITILARDQSNARSDQLLLPERRQPSRWGVVFLRRLRNVTTDKKECGRGLRPRPHLVPPGPLSVTPFLTG